jgi:hypothetical protein
MAVARRDEFVELLQRHGASLSRIRGSRGVIPCILHQDRTPSLSIDMNRGIFHCFGCGAQGGLLDLRRLLGDETGSRTTPRHHRPRRFESPLQQARREVMLHEQRAAATRAEWLPWHALNAYAGRSAHAVREARALATRIGPDDPRTWPLLERAARVECENLALEAELDALAMGRLA